MSGVKNMRELWIVSPTSRSRLELEVMARGVPVATVCASELSGRDHEKDARLIAAAPDLLEALEWLVETMDDPDSAHLGRACDYAISTLARARGEP